MSRWDASQQACLLRASLARHETGRHSREWGAEGRKLLFEGFGRPWSVITVPIRDGSRLPHPPMAFTRPHGCAASAGDPPRDNNSDKTSNGAVAPPTYLLSHHILSYHVLLCLGDCYDTFDPCEGAWGGGSSALAVLASSVCIYLLFTTGFPLYCFMKITARPISINTCFGVLRIKIV